MITPKIEWKTRWTGQRTEIAFSLSFETKLFFRVHRGTEQGGHARAGRF